MYRLETYRGPSSRYTCPSCGQRKTFTRYINEKGEHLADDVGRCDRAKNCRYHKPPREHFSAANKAKNSRAIKSCSWIDETRLTGRLRSPSVADTIPLEHLIETLNGYESDTFICFLLSVFSDQHSRVFDAIRSYFVGTYNGYTVFPKIDRFNLVRSAKLIKFDPQTGKRIRKDRSISSLQHMLKKQGVLSSEFETDKEVYFGEHLLERLKPQHIAIVESEKTAIIATIALREKGKAVWLATGSKQCLKVDRLYRIGPDRRFILYPDSDGYADWARVAAEGRRLGIDVQVSDLIENSATEAEKLAGFDLADYLVRENVGLASFSNSFAGM